jgi:hypothetical protein
VNPKTNFFDYDRASPAICQRVCSSSFNFLGPMHSAQCLRERVAQEFGAGHTASIVRERLDNTSKLSPMPSSYLRIHALLGSLTAAGHKGRRRRGYGYDPLSEDRPSDLDRN